MDERVHKQVGAYGLRFPHLCKTLDKLHRTWCSILPSPRDAAAKRPFAFRQQTNKHNSLPCDTEILFFFFSFLILANGFLDRIDVVHSARRDL